MTDDRQWKLKVTDGPDAGRSFSLSGGQPLLIGRGSQSDTQIKDPSISRLHCEIGWDGQTPRICDRGSASGTLVDGHPVDASQTLQSGMTIRLGDTELQIQCEDDLNAKTAIGASVVAAQSPVDEPPELSIGKIRQFEGHVFLRFKLEQLIKVSPASVVFRGIDIKHDRKVAIKILRTNMVSTETQRERFIRAMRTMLPVKHPNIVRTRKAGRTGPYCWAAFDWVEGVSVAELIETIGISGMLDWREVVRVAVHIARALDEADRHQIVHRNVTPSNLLRRNSDQAFLLTDLIFARALEYTDAPQLTRPGEIVGDLGYMAPERIADSTAVDARGDQYSLGATLYALLTGEPPYQAHGLAQLIEQHRSTDPKHPSEYQMGLNEDFCHVVMRMLSKTPDQRYESPGKLLIELEKVCRLGGIESDWVSWQG